MTSFLSQLHRNAQKINYCEQYAPQIFQASDELRALGFIVKHHPSGYGKDCFMKVCDGDTVLIAKYGPGKIISPDTLVELRRLVEQRNVENRLAELLDRFSAVGWVCQIDEDHRIHLEKSAPANTRTYWPTYESLRRIEHDLLQAEFLRRAYPYRQKLRSFAQSAWRQIDCHLTMLQLMLRDSLTPPSINNSGSETSAMSPDSGIAESSATDEPIGDSPDSISG